MEFKKGWISIDLGDYRPHADAFATYSLFSYEDLPPVTKEFSGDFSWLNPLHKELADKMAIYQPGEEHNEELRKNLEEMIAEATSKNVELPDEFVFFMRSPTLQVSIPSVTACYFDLSTQIIPSPFEKGAYMVRFLNDQQGCGFWYLYLCSDQSQQILVSWLLLDDLERKSDSIFYSSYYEEECSVEDLHKSIFYCAPAFEEFIYRYWIENTSWFGIKGDTPLNEEQKQYLKHYKDE